MRFGEIDTNLIDMSKVILALLIVGLASANLHPNVKFRDVVQGAQPLTERIAQQIYLEYHSPHFVRSDYRFQVFYNTLKEISAHNAGDHTWTQGINDFSDMTFEEFKENKLMAPQNCSATSFLKLKAQFDISAIPESYEWNDLGMVSPVKNQGSCGSCWTFSTVGAMESHWNILGKGRNLTFSEQQLVDCAGDFDNHGCNGGLPSHAFEYIKHVGGLESDATYPYKAKTLPCVHRPEISVAHCRYGSFNITQGDEDQLAERLYNAGPISVSFQVITGFKNYAGGVYSVSNCGTGTQDVNHAVLATGYGVEKGVKFWNIKNSWGGSWGTSGYFKMERGANMCAIGQCNSYPLIDNIRDFEVKVAQE